MSKRKERPPQQRQLDLYRIVELMRSGGLTSQQIADELNEGRPEEWHIKAVTVRAQWAEYRRRVVEPKTRATAEEILAKSIEEHEMDRREALRGFAKYLAEGNPSAPSFLMVAHRARLRLDDLRGVKPLQDEGPDEKDTGEAFETIEAAREYLQKAGLGGRILPYADTRKKRGR